MIVLSTVLLSTGTLPKWRETVRSSCSDAATKEPQRHHAVLKRTERVEVPSLLSGPSLIMSPLIRRSDGSSSKGSNLSLCSSLSLPLSSSTRSSLLSLPVPVSPGRLHGGTQPNSPRSRSSTLSFPNSSSSTRSSTHSSGSSRSNSRSPTLSRRSSQYSYCDGGYQYNYAGVEEELDDAFEDDDVMMVCPPELAAVAAPHIRAALLYRANAGLCHIYINIKITVKRYYSSATRRSGKK